MDIHLSRFEIIEKLDNFTGFDRLIDDKVWLERNAEATDGGVQECIAIIAPNLILDRHPNGLTIRGGERPGVPARPVGIAKRDMIGDV